MPDLEGSYIEAGLDTVASGRRTAASGYRGRATRWLYISAIELLRYIMITISENMICV